MDPELQAEIDKQLTEARIHWIIVAAIYAGAAEIALFLAGKKVSIDSLPDSNEEIYKENMNVENSFVSNGFEQDFSNNVSEENLVSNNTEDIKFDL